MLCCQNYKKEARLTPVLWILDILVRMRIWIRLKILLFPSLAFKMPTKHSFFCYFHFEGTFTSVFKDKVIKKSQNSRNHGFSYYFCLMIEGAGSKPLTNGSGSRRPKTNTDPTDPHPNPQHWFPGRNLINGSMCVRRWDLEGGRYVEVGVC
jgi:hypothetical protein